jgi:hypothetical protein
MFKQFKLIDKTSSYKSGSSVAGVGVNSKNLSPEEYKSLIFNSGSSQYLNRTFSETPFTYTFSCWAKRSKLTASQMIVGCRTGGVRVNQLSFNATDNLAFSSQATGDITTTAVYRDTSAWYHIVVAVNPSGTAILYVNGVQVGSAATDSTPSLFNSSLTNAIGRYGDSASNYFDGYISEIHFVDGQKLTPDSFGYFDTIGIWQPRKYSGSYGINGFYLPLNNPNFFELAKDKSGNSNHWTLNGYSSSLARDVVVSDSPVNNYATLNPLDQSGCTFTNGLLDVAMSGNGFAVSSIGVSSGKWYAEAIVTSASLEMIGICQIDGTVLSRQYLGANGWYYYAANGQKYNNGTGSSYGATYTTNDIIGIALDMDSGSVTFYKNGTTQGVAYSSGISGKTIAFALGRGSASGSNTTTFNFGQRPFAYTPPTGFKALCTTNLSTPTIKKPSSYFDAVAFTATNSAGSVSSLSFQPDLTWIKDRDSTIDHYLHDSIRGYGNFLSSNTTGVSTPGGGVTSQLSNGFNYAIGNTNRWISWSWDAGSSSVTNTSGTITSTVRANPQAGFSIVSFVNASGTNQATVGHGLGSSPKMIISKNLDTSANNWAVFHSAVCDTTSKFLQLNTTAALITFATVWGASLPTSSVFGVTGGGIAAASVNIIAYCFAEVEGFSKFGSYTGNGSADGPFIYCGFRPRFVLTKNSSSGAGGYDWVIWDAARNPSNQAAKVVFPDLGNAEEETTTIIDILSNGFKLRNSGATTNAGTMIFAAFAETPFKYSRAR